MLDEHNSLCNTLIIKVISKEAKKMNSGKIIGIGSYLPPRVLTNDELSTMVETNDEWITRRTGISTRHIADGIIDKTTTMAIKAAIKAVEDSGINGEEIDLIVAASTTPDLVFPGIACMVQKELGATNASCFDINSACPGFIAALNTAEAYIESGNSSVAVVVASETLSNYVDWEDRRTCILFGDGAGAVVLKGEERTRMNFVFKASGDRGELLLCENMKQPRRDKEEDFHKNTFIAMDGAEVFKFAITEVPEIIRSLMEKLNLSDSDIDHFILHQANRRIIETVAKKLDISIDKFPMNIDRVGNISSASIPILLDELNRQGTIRRGDKIILSSFGGGLTWGATYLEY